jgi:hypothetical protein
MTSAMGQYRERSDRLTSEAINIARPIKTNPPRTLARSKPVTAFPVPTRYFLTSNNSKLKIVKFPPQYQQTLQLNAFCSTK